MKKAEERRYLDAFFELRPDFIVSDIVGSESPDFICCVDGVKVGIEMTRFFFPSSEQQPPQAKEAYRDQLARDLRRGHAARGFTPLHISVHFHSDELLMRASGRSFLVEELLDFVQNNIPPPGPHKEFSYDDLPRSLHEAGVNSILVLNLPKLTKPFWSVPQFSFIPESHAALIQNIASTKSSFSVRYRKEVSTLWLLIVSGVGGLHSMIDFDRDVLSANYSSTFDRIFLFRTFDPSIHELKKAE